MSDIDTQEAQAPSELDALKARATQLGVKFHPSISVEKLREKVADAMSDEPKDEDTETEAPVAEGAESETQKRVRLKKEATKKIRIRLTCMNQAKKDWNGEIISVGNNVIGTIKEYVPYVAEDGWHVSNAIYQVLKERKFQTFVNEKAKNGVSVRRGKMIPEFAIEVLPQLTEKELKELARVQAMQKAED